MNDDERVTFAGAIGSERRVEGAWTVYPNSILFKAGSYPDKRLEMTIGDIDHVCQSFNPSDGAGNIEHTAFLSGRAARIRKVWREGDLLRGEVAIPTALDDLLIDDERKLSCEFYRPTKTIAGIALTTDPRYKEAALMSAYANFARHDTDQGQYALQAMHDHACRHGAVCDKKNIDMSSRHEATAIQQVHDTCVEHGAKCASTAGNRPAMFAGNGGKGTKMPTLKERAIAWFTGRGFSVDKEVDDAEFNAAVATFSATSAKPAESDEVKQLRQQIVEMHDSQRRRDAQAFADDIVAMKKALPCERVSIAAAFYQAAVDDTAHPAKVVFSNEKGEPQEGSRVDQLKALYTARPEHKLTEELLRDAVADDAQGAYALFSKAKTADASKEPGSGRKKEELLAMTQIGQTVLSGRGN